MPIDDIEGRRRSTADFVRHTRQGGVPIDEHDLSDIEFDTPAQIAVERALSVWSSNFLKKKLSWPLPRIVELIEYDPASQVESKVLCLVEPEYLPGELEGRDLDQAIMKALAAVIARQKFLGQKKLNGKEQVGRAMELLRQWGITSKRSLKGEVERISDDKFGGEVFRDPRGVTSKSRRTARRAPRST
jgi:hypothetical protein